MIILVIQNNYSNHSSSPTVFASIFTLFFLQRCLTPSHISWLRTKWWRRNVFRWTAPSALSARRKEVQNCRWRWSETWQVCHVKGGAAATFALQYSAAKRTGTKASSSEVLHSFSALRKCQTRVSTAATLPTISGRLPKCASMYLCTVGVMLSLLHQRYVHLFVKRINKVKLASTSWAFFWRIK